MRKHEERSTCEMVDTVSCTQKRHVQASRMSREGCLQVRALNTAVLSIFNRRTSLGLRPLIILGRWRLFWTHVNSEHSSSAVSFTNHR